MKKFKCLSVLLGIVLFTVSCKNKELKGCSYTIILAYPSGDHDTINVDNGLEPFIEHPYSLKQVLVWPELDESGRIVRYNHSMPISNYKVIQK